MKSNKRRRSASRTLNVSELNQYLPVIFIAFVFLVGGSSRSEALSYLVLTPVSFVMLAIGAYSASREQWREWRVIWLFIAAIAATAIIQLVPLPPSIWQALPGRQMLAEVDAAIGLSQTWRPISLTPDQTAYSLWWLATPAALALLLTRDDRAQALMVRALLGLGLFAVLLSVGQLLGPPKGLLYFYDATNEGSAVGPFANRNHLATFLACQFPLLALFAAEPTALARTAKVRLIGCFALAGFYVLMILITGSRAGLLVGGVGVAASFLIYSPEAGRKMRGDHVNRGGIIVSGVIYTVLVALLAVLLSRAEAVERLFSPDDGAYSRAETWRLAWDQAWGFFPFGSGLGSFQDVFQIFETDQSLGPYHMNRVHNDLVEVFYTSGLLGLAIMLAFAIWMFRTGISLYMSNARQSARGRRAWCGLSLVAMLSLASVSDYPLRLPSLACLLVVSIVWALGSLDGSSAPSSKRS